jgi:hypothetical protein
MGCEMRRCSRSQIRKTGARVHLGPRHRVYVLEHHLCGRQVANCGQDSGGAYRSQVAVSSLPAEDGPRGTTLGVAVGLMLMRVQSSLLTTGLPARHVRPAVELQRQLDEFTACYNTTRPHRAIGRKGDACGEGFGAGVERPGSGWFGLDGAQRCGRHPGHDPPARSVPASASRPLPAPGVRHTRVGRRS